MAPLQLACVSSSAATLALVRESLGLAFPAATFDAAEPSLAYGVPEAHAIVVDAAPDGSRVDVVRALRARGFLGGLVLLHAAPDDQVRERAARAGVTAIVAPVDAARRLGDAIVASLPAPAVDAVAARAWVELRRAQQLIAAGEVAMRLQHALANPLTALLAEAQLLEMEPLLPLELRGAVARILEQSRRTIAVARRLDHLSGPAVPPP